MAVLKLVIDYSSKMTVEAILSVPSVAEQLVGGVVNLGGGCERTVAESAAKVLDLVGSRIPVVEVPQNRRPTEMQRSYFDNAEIAALLEWHPRRDLRTGLQLTIADLVQSRSKHLAAAPESTSRAESHVPR